MLAAGGEPPIACEPSVADYFVVCSKHELFPSFVRKPFRRDWDSKLLRSFCIVRKSKIFDDLNPFKSRIGDEVAGTGI